MGCGKKNFWMAERIFFLSVILNKLSSLICQFCCFFMINLNNMTRIEFSLQIPVLTLKMSRMSKTKIKRNLRAPNDELSGRYRK